MNEPVPTTESRLRVLSFESRRAEEMRGLIERHGAIAKSLTWKKG